MGAGKACEGGLLFLEGWPFSRVLSSTDLLRPTNLQYHTIPVCNLKLWRAKFHIFRMKVGAAIVDGLVFFEP